MFDIRLRELKDQMMDPLCEFIPDTISPGLLTFFSFLSGLTSCYAIASSDNRFYPIFFWFLNRFLDCLDGSVARYRGVATELGGFLDLLSDFIIYSLIPISVALGQDRQRAITVDWRAIAFLEASFHINNFVLFYVAAVASKRAANELTSVSMKPALVEGFESALFFTNMLFWPEGISLQSWVMTGAVCFGIVQRIVRLVPSLQLLDGNAHKSK